MDTVDSSLLLYQKDLELEVEEEGYCSLLLLPLPKRFCTSLKIHGKSLIKPIHLISILEI